MSGDARQAVEDLEAKNRFDSDHEQTSLHHDNPDADIHSENDDGPMSQLGQPTELLNSNEPRGCGIPPWAAGPTEPRSRWITKTEWTHYIQEDPHCPRPSDASIFRVPKFLKDTKREAYVPERVSLGPYHHGSAELPSMGHHKGRALRRMMKRFNANQNLPVDPNDMDFANRAMEEILKLENQIRDSYEENIDCDGETLARMLCLDGCFLIEVLRSLVVDNLERSLVVDNLSRDEEDELVVDNLSRDEEDEEDKWHYPIFGVNKPAQDEEDKWYYPIFGVNKPAQDEEDKWYYPIIGVNKPAKDEDPIFGVNKLEYAAKVVLDDILKLENQIPFIVLLKLLQLELNLADDDVEYGFFVLLKRGILRKVIPFNDVHFDANQWLFRHHLLGWFHTIMVSPTVKQGEEVDPGKCSILIDRCSSKCIRLLQGTRKALQGKRKAWNAAGRIPHAVELRNAGIKFKPLQRGIMEINFDKNSATIFLPPILVMDGTERFFRNLIAFEMDRTFRINYMTCYVSLMDDLIDSEQDVALLRRMGVLTNCLGSDKQVADIFNGLCEGITESSADVFDTLAEKVNAHYNNEMKVQIGILVQDHCSSPWKGLALIAAIVLLVLAVLQTIFTIISTYKK